MPDLFSESTDPGGVKITGVACRCGSSRLMVSWQTIHGGRSHLRADCATCQKLVKYLPQTPDLVRLASKEKT